MKEVIGCNAMGEMRNGYKTVVLRAWKEVAVWEIDA
jgi:hypothetical protein